MPAMLQINLLDVRTNMYLGGQADAWSVHIDRHLFHLTLKLPKLVAATGCINKPWQCNEKCPVCAGVVP